MKASLFDRFLGFAQIVDTDYKGHLILYSCMNEVQPNMKSEYVMIASRDPNVPNKSRVSFLELANKKIT